MSGLFIFLVLISIIVTSLLDEKSNIKLKVSEECYRKLVEQSPFGIIIHEFGKLTYVNKAVMEILAAKKENELIGRNVLDLIDQSYHEILRNRWNSIQLNPTVDTLEEKMIRLAHKVIDVEMKGIPYEENGVLKVQVFFQDITARKDAEKLVYQMAYYDSLTHLPNRRLFNERLNAALQSEKDIAVMFIDFIDLDGFKQVNDNYGHDIGDELLKKAAKNIKECVGEHDTASRLAGDEFAIQLSNIDYENTLEIAEDIIKKLDSPIKIDDIEVSITSSIGISFNSNKLKDSDKLIKEADSAMYQAKVTGKNRYYVYE
ncbi:sensor domain-containing diguanylate cyclase [Bacillus pinisoli]|uniref:sensor domain-containing diguanylate cyclase n=1 Tax=Bacillus pinisoli TaxID=2901866 RepID=UPI001FF197E4|nr:sensor domain-containing diguanylate cyclase [Bacillus pinisoli]